MNGHDYVKALAEEYRNHLGLGLKDAAADVLEEIKRVADEVDGVWHPKENLRENLTVEAAAPAAAPETATPASATEKAA